VIKSIARPWSIYVGVLAVLALAERVVAPEARGADRLLGIAINWVAFVGLMVAAVHSVRAARRAAERDRRGLGVGTVVTGGFIGPLVATIVVTMMARNVDGAMWMLASPLLSVVIVLVTLAVTAVTELRRRAGASMTGRGG
jgi:hypothetical protein